MYDTYIITRDGKQVGQTESPLAWFLRNVPYSMSHALEHEGYGYELNRRDRALFAERAARMDAIEGPRVGDYVIFADGVTRRISHIWPAYNHPTDGHPASVQTSDGGSFHLHASGHVSFSGSLYSGVPADTLTPSSETRPGDVWIFHHDMPGAGRAVHQQIDFRVFRCSRPALTV